MPKINTYRSFKEARDFVRTLKFSSVAEFRKWVNGEVPEKPAKPDDIPSNPHQVYRDKFAGYSDFLGTGRVATYRREYASFSDARDFIRKLELESIDQYRYYVATHDKPEAKIKLPRTPDSVYALEGWEGWGDFLGTGREGTKRGRHWRPFWRARTFARSLKLKSWGEWRKYTKGELSELPDLPHDIPAVPSTVYKRNGWTSYPDFLGTDTRAFHSSNWLPFEEARAIVRAQNLRSSEWADWVMANKSLNIPHNPDRVYDNWVSWKDFLREPGKYRRPARTLGT